MVSDNGSNVLSPIRHLVRFMYEKLLFPLLSRCIAYQFIVVAYKSFHAQGVCRWERNFVAKMSPSLIDSYYIILIPNYNTPVILFLKHNWATFHCDKMKSHKLTNEQLTGIFLLWQKDRPFVIKQALYFA